jgi:predicted RNase H-like HicB family nuclease
MTTKSLKHTVIIYWSEGDEAFVAEIPDLPGCAADGVTPEQALANVQLVASEWIEAARELVRPVPEPKGR